MEKYKLMILGWELETSAHSLSQDQYQSVLDYMSENDIESLDEISDELENIIENYSRIDGNMFSFSRPLLSAGDAYLKILDDTNKELATINFRDVKKRGNFQDPPLTPYNAMPDSSGKDYILFTADNNKGVLFGAEIESIGIPSIHDFSYTENILLTPEGNIVFMETIFFKDDPIEENYDFSDIDGKSTETYLFAKE